MNILILALSKISSFNDKGMYADISRELLKKKNNVFFVHPTERRNKKKTFLKKEGNNGFLLAVRTLNIQKTSIIEKGLGTILITNQFKKAIKKYFKGIRFDLILYPTPPITLFGVVKYFKKRDNARTYLMLKDIFPQNAVDLGIMKTTGCGRVIYKYFRKQEKKLYAVSDFIGCMSPANVEYVLKHNPEISEQKVGVFPNCIDIQRIHLTGSEKNEIKKKYGLPLDRKIFIYGGNLGRPQGIPFVINCLKAETTNDKAFFVIVGDGTEYGKLDKYSSESHQSNFKLLKRLPTEEFDKLLASSDVGLIFLDYRFTIPNFPSRLLSYLQASLPVLACTDSSTDVGNAIVDANIGWHCLSNDVESFKSVVEHICTSNCPDPAKVFEYALNNFDTKKCVDKLLLPK